METVDLKTKSILELKGLGYDLVITIERYRADIDNHRRALEMVNQELDNRAKENREKKVEQKIPDTATGQAPVKVVEQEGGY